MLDELHKMKCTALTKLQQAHIRSFEQISPLIRPILDKIVIMNDISPYACVKTTEYSCGEAACNFLVYSQSSKYALIESNYFCQWAQNGSYSCIAAIPFLEDFDKIEDDDTPIHSLLKGADIFEPTDPELELTIKTTFAGMPDFIISKKQLQRVVAWLGVAEISPEGETESQQLFCKLFVELIKPVSTPTIEETIELLKNEQISKQSTTITEILPRLQELFMNDDRESWMKIYAMLSVTIPKLDIIQQLNEIKTMGFFECANPDLCATEILKVVTESVILYWRTEAAFRELNFHSKIVLHPISGNGTEVKLRIFKQATSVIRGQVDCSIEFEAEDQSYQSLLRTSECLNTDLIDRLAAMLGLSFPSGLVDLIAWIWKAPIRTYDNRTRNLAYTLIPNTEDRYKALLKSRDKG
jgi:hypothetical protein